MIGKPLTEMQEVSLYIHIPFCTTKCPYCHFYVIPDHDPFKHKLLTSLKQEWQLHQSKLHEKNIVSIYFGGGTPSLMGPEGIGTILSWLPHNGSQEITLEVNPENVTLPLMEEFYKIGINRVSLGVQSLDNALLKRLGRTHTAQKAMDAVELTDAAGIKNISIDLMFDLPSQTVKSWEKTLLQLDGLPISHLSLYNLTIEPHTGFHKKQAEITPLLPSPEDSLAMLEKATSFLPSYGLSRYEISAFAKEGFHSKHNTGYWTARPFLGLGPSAFSYWKGKRFRNIANLNQYAATLAQNLLPIDFEEELTFPDNLNELLAIELRLLQGVHLPTFQSRHDTLPPSTHASLEEASSRGWLTLTPTYARLSPSGLLFYDSLATLLI